MSSGTDHILHEVWGNSASDVFAVGSAGTILHYDGQVWTAMDSGSNNGLEGICGSSLTDVFAVGNEGTILQYGG